ncbi:ribosome biogenesis factor YjgA [Marinimicrobium sp. ABcell2]|uniref:ribosome biogenesis factor YjgA n=1 Tax=Marinimicrobium sp. ABcell2 TaxID=3069751 RepID=UPI0027B65B91|nr:ribosome biogenesis factor YjgA [Marinimicrobium sp. ABcell2]MDQ2078280.1 ribosome biogenesis factor YjgA [Marinimicrobium sp. ABcell2]
MIHEQPDEFEGEEPVSKSQRKRESLALQKLGKTLTELKPQQLTKIPLADDLREAITELERIHHREGRRRHLQFIGKLMRSADHDAIQQALDGLQKEGLQQVQQQHLVEQWRDRLLSEEKEALAEFVDAYQPDDIQQLNQLIRQARKEKAQEKPPAAARKLFRFVRDTLT